MQQYPEHNEEPRQRTPFYKWLILVLLVLLSFGGAFLLIVHRGGFNRPMQFMLTSDSLEIQGNSYGLVLPRDALDLSGARIVHSDDPDVQPVRRTNGIAYNPYFSGWWQTANGQKMLLFLRRRDNVIYIPTNKGYGLLIGPADSRKFLRSLQNGDSDIQTDGSDMEK